MSLERLLQRRRRDAGGPLVVHLSPAPEAALPLLPLAGAAPEAEVEFQALLTRIPADRSAPPALLSVHRLGGRLGQRLAGRLGPRGEYEVEFVPRRGAEGQRIILSAFRFALAGAPGGGPRESSEAERPDIELDEEVPRRIDPPMEPEEEGALVLQITGRLTGSRGEDQ